MQKRKEPTSDALEIVDRLFIDGKPEMVALLEEAREEAEIAREIYRLRTEAGLTQRELARMVGTSSSVISRLENADYQGRSLSTLRRVGKALNRRVDVRFVTMT